MLGGLITIAGGAVASSGFIISRRPDARNLIDKITPYTGWIGVVMLIWGIKEIIFCLRAISLLSTHPVNWSFWLATGIADFGVGFLLGFGLISKYVLSRSEMAREKGQLLRQKLIKIQTPLGLLAIVMGILYIVL